MAIRLIDRYPSRVDPATSNYPHGQGRNKSDPTADDGTPFDEDRFNDQEAFFQGLCARAGITPSGTVDTVLVSDYLDALRGSLIADNLADLQAFPTQYADAGYIMQTAGRSAFGDGGEGHFRWDSSDLSTEVGNDEVTTGEGDGGIYVAPASDKTGASGAWVRIGSDNLILSDYYGVSSAGDNLTNLTAMFNAAGGKTVLLTVSTESSDELTMPDDCVFDLGGNTLTFHLAQNVRCLSTGNDCVVKNGKVKVTENAFTLAGSGDLGCPISIGFFSTNSGRGKSNVIISDIEADTVKADGNNISVLGDSHNILLRNIICPDNANVGRAILTHWGFDGVDEANGTWHPYNVRMDNIRIGALTRADAFDTAAIFISGSFNVTAENVHVDRCRRGCVVYSGDLADDHAQNGVFMISKNITVRRFECAVVENYGLYAAGEGDSTTELDTDVTFDQCILNGDVGSNNGVQIDNCQNVRIRDCEITQFRENGISIGQNTDGVQITGCEIHGNHDNGINLNTGSPRQRFIVKGNYIHDNNQTSSGTALSAGIYINAINSIIMGNIIGRVTETQDFGVRAASTCDDLVISDNQILDATSTGLSFGSSTDDFRVYGANNYISSGITNPHGGVPLLTGLLANQGGVQVVSYASAIPQQQTWNKGDIVFYDDTVAGGKVGAVCVTAGSPGTWKEFGNVDA